MCLGVPGKIIEIYETNNVRMGKVDFGGVIKEACLDFLPDIQVGDYTIIHVGFGISQIDEEEAMKTLEMLRELDMLADELPELTEDEA
ncbi:MAG TPA: hydrogenase assembly protein HypC [Chloroflexi bacterium]|nr:hydrogenase assembly protein HypC [Chloroflexota bacterium]